VSLARAVTSNISGTDGHISEIWYGNTTNSSDNIVLTCSVASSLGWIGITVGKWTGATVGTPQLTAFGFPNDPQTTPAITIAPGGVGIVCLQADNDATPTWNIGSPDYDSTSGAAAFSLMRGSISATGSQTPSISGFAFAGTSMVALPLADTADTLMPMQALIFM